MASHQVGASNISDDTPSKTASTLLNNRFVAILRNIFLGTDVAKVPLFDPKELIAFNTLEKNLSTGTKIDDRNGVLQAGFELMAKSGSKSPITQKCNDAAVALLHNKAYSNFLQKSLPSTLPVDGSGPGENLPDVETVFDELLKAKAKTRVDHTNGISSLAFAFTSLLHLSLLRTYRGNTNYDEVSPYFNLSPLYGANKNDEEKVRDKNQSGRGMLLPDCFSEGRIMLLSPPVVALLVLWNRNHNFIARRLLTINEGEKWIDPLKSPGHSRLKFQDDDIFDLARSINLVQFKNVIVEDLMKGLLGLANVGNSANLNPLNGVNTVDDHDNKLKTSAEFNMLYQWSTMMSQADEDWLTATLKEIPQLHGKASSEISVDLSMEAMQMSRFADPTLANCAGLKREKNGQFKDSDLTKVLQQATESVAGAPRAFGTPECMRPIELIIMAEARGKVCTLNEFRTFLGLKPFKSFKEWNATPEVCKAATRLYTDINRLELHPGLLAEENMPGFGFCLGYTMTFGLLVDIVTQVRNDSRFSKELTPQILTKWGYNECVLNLEASNGAFGANLPRLILRNLPHNYTYNNVYGLFPFTLPSKVEADLAAIDKARAATEPRNANSTKIGHLYEFEKPRALQIVHLKTKTAISYVFNRCDKFPTPYKADLKYLTNGYGYMLGFDDEKLHDADQIMTLYALMPDTRSFAEYGSYFTEITQRLIKEKSKDSDTKDSRTIDIVRDVINPACTRWVCETICGLSITNDKEIESNFEKFASLYAYVFRKSDPHLGWTTRSAAYAASKELNTHIDKQLTIVSTPIPDGWVAYITRVAMECCGGRVLKSSSAETFLGRLAKTSRTVGRFANIIDHPEFKGAMSLPGMAGRRQLERRRLIANVLGLSVVASVNYAQACSLAVNFYLDPARSKELEEIIKLIKDDGPNTNALIMGYIREAQRLGQPLGLFRDVKKSSTPKRTNSTDSNEKIDTTDSRRQPKTINKDDDNTSSDSGTKAEYSIPQGHNLPDITVQEGQCIYADFMEAHMNAQDFPDPDKIDPNRVVHSIQGMGLHKCPGITFVDNTMPEIFKAIFSLENLRRAEGREGQLAKVTTHPISRKTDPINFIDTTGETTPFPRSLIVQYDGAPKFKEKKWKVTATRPTIYKKLLDWILYGISIISTLWKIYSMFRSPIISISVGRPRVMQEHHFACNPPTTVFHKWDINTILPGPDGQPAPIEYTLEHKKPHQLSIVDIDARDMQLGVYVDGIMRGLTTEFQLDKSVNCGEDIKSCLNQNFSGGVVVVPPGKHSVKIAWEGKEFIPGSKDIDWGNEYSRRLKWQLEYCS